ncbi:non-hemolytic enterotoxin subunit B [Bacillus cereus]|uniref:non-hemolytic enterotoxin subunit B n=1 Tax=Bacillus cereus TaxID=1396 RepID=UPI000BF65FA8|nr:HBL/NHE enterotoxin family protein [Bacillus cereus]PFN11499.1 enterotoxin [Bacillus cereus]
MKKTPYKVMALSALLAVVTASNIVPTHTVAAENTVQTIQVSNMKKNMTSYKDFEYQLGPEGLREAMATTGSNALVMDLYALTLIKQQNADFTNVDIIDEKLRAAITTHQNVGRSNATKWLDMLKPKLITTNQNIINYNTKFQNYYDTLLDAVDATDKATLKKGLSNLNTSISIYKKDVDNLIAELISFRDRMATDTQNFKADTSSLVSILTSEDSGLPILQQQIDAYNAAIAKDNAIIIGGSVALGLGAVGIIGGGILIGTGAGSGLGVTLVVGGVSAIAGGTTAIVLAKQNIDSSREGIRDLTLNLNDTKAQMVVVNNIKNQCIYLSDTIDLAIVALQNISNQWHSMSARYTTLIENVDSINPDEFAFIKEDLHVASDSWKDIKEYADKLYTDIKVVETDGPEL